MKHRWLPSTYTIIIRHRAIGDMYPLRVKNSTQNFVERIEQKMKPSRVSMKSTEPSMKLRFWLQFLFAFNECWHDTSLWLMQYSFYLTHTRTHIHNHMFCEKKKKKKKQYSNAQKYWHKFVRLLMRLSSLFRFVSLYF